MAINDNIDRHHLKVWGADDDDDPVGSDDKYMTNDEYMKENYGFQLELADAESEIAAVYESTIDKEYVNE